MSKYAKIVGLCFETVANNLEVKETIFPISARLIANKSSFKFKGTDIEKIVESIKNQVKNND